MSPTLPASLSRRDLVLAGLMTALTGPALAQGLPMSVNALTARANAGTVGIISGGVDGTYIRIAADLAAVLDDGDTLRVLAIVGKGSLRNIADILLLRGIDIGIVQSDALAFARRQRILPGVGTLIQYIAKLYDEEIHILARADIRMLEDLAGKPVNVDVPGSGTAMTASLVFDMLGIPVVMTDETQDVALTRLRRGEIAAMAFVAGKPARIFGGVPAGSDLHFLPIPATPELIETYLPSSLASADYPMLIAPGTTVETIAVGAVMAVYAWQPGSDRHRKVSRFIEALHAQFGEFLRPPRHPKWREVNLAAEVPGWVRFEAAPSAARLTIR
ncbi:TRAP transporter TAXI family solute receptor [Humitalea rosea]|uniref:TRAP transporter TAXI family solute receptor n=1 Tax=Humitalea rosea TaxID=990373 RepID=A0A2W7JV84_9PROT|nr:TAXI family TRAP transporter solute-binding subunit [Humitalea rosea]PZW39360.1 TRAP transporter TAXI family solute receptor [Humitalea rosea]